MKIIDNRYKIENMINNNIYYETYEILDLWGADRAQFMKLYHYDMQKDLIDYFIGNFIHLSNMKHDNIMSIDKFDIVKTIDTKNTNMLLYYLIYESIDLPTLVDVKDSLTFEDRIKIIIDIILTIDFLHFRGFHYKFLNPSLIYITEDNKIKLQDLASLVEKSQGSKYNDFERNFISGDFFVDGNENDNIFDYYSMGVIIKYLLIENYLTEDSNNYIYLDSISDTQKEKLNIIIKRLMSKDFTNTKYELINLADRIIDIFELDYSYDLVQSRDSLFFKNRIVGRDKEISKAMSINQEIENKTNKYKGLVVRGEYGIGKTRVVSELSHRLKLQGHDVYNIKINSNDNNDLLDMSNILKQAMKDTPTELLEKYRDELSKILPELRLFVDETTKLDLSQNAERFRLYNRITNYFIDLSSDKIIYIVIDDLQHCNNNFLMLLDYLILNLKNGNIFFLFTYEENPSEESKTVKEMLNYWISNSFIEKMDLHKLDLEENGEIVKNILGISYVPLSLSSVLYSESQGNPMHIEYLIKHLYNTNELYMDKRGSWYLKSESYASIYFPTSINDTLLKQLSIIKEKYYDIFKVMSIIEDLLNKKTLLKVLDMDPKKLERDLSELIRLKLIDEKLVDWGYSYNINNNELKKLIYQEISNDEKIALHRKIAQSMEELDGENLDSIIEELLYHLIQSEQSEKALDLILDKVQGLENRYSNQARFLLEKAYGIEKNNIGPMKLRILELLLDIYFLKGESEKANAYLDEYKRDSKATKDYKHMINALTIEININYRKAEPDKASKGIKAIEKIADENNIIEGKIIALSLKARFNLREGEYNKAQEKIYKALDLCEKFGLNSEMGALYNRLGLTKNLLGNPLGALDDYKKSIAFYKKTDKLIDATRPMNNMANIYIDYFEDVDKAMESYKAGLEVANRFGIQEAEIVFLINIASIYLDGFQMDKSLKYIKEAKDRAIELHDLNMTFSAINVMAEAYLISGEYENAYKCYMYLEEKIRSKEVTDVENILNYHLFLGRFYGTCGKWKASMENLNIAFNMTKGYKVKENLMIQTYKFFYKYYENNYFNKDEIEDIRMQYKETLLIRDRRKSLITFAFMSLIKGDYNYAKDLLNEDNILKAKMPCEFFDKANQIILLTINSTNDDMVELIKIENDLTIKDPFSMKQILNSIIGLELLYKGDYKASLKYLIDSLDLIYKSAIKFPSFDLKRSYSISRHGDLVKTNIKNAIKKAYNYDLKTTSLKDITEDRLEYYFDITPVIDLIGSEEFAKINQLNYYGEALEINSVETLVSRLTMDFKQNLDLILAYVSKETFAKTGFILDFDEDTKKYEIVSSLDKNLDHKINESILNLASRMEKGILINKNINDNLDHGYKELLTEDIRGIICIPIDVYKEGNTIDQERRKEISEDRKSQGYIYLETDKSFNKFDFNKFEMINNLAYLIYSNLENNRLRLISTTDKLTGLYTRKYYESEFDHLINMTKSKDGYFSVLMLDIDRFKNVNDTYGHRKGDEVLTNIGALLKSLTRSTDIIARYGGEEFIILLKNTLEEDAIDIAEKIREAVQKLKVQGVEYQITISIGISSFPNHSQFKEELIEKADQALYQAKETGRNKVVLWDYKMDNASNRMDKLAGILTSNTDEDNRNILALVDIIELIKEDEDIDKKIYTFLGRIMETVEAEEATIVVKAHKDKEEVYYSRARFDDDWIETPILNTDIINRVKTSNKGEFIIDWDNLDNIDSLSGLPNWQSVIVLPMIKGGKTKGVLYVTTALKNKEFSFNNYNIVKNLTNIFAALI